MSRNLSVTEIKEAISEIALACFWLSGSYNNYWLYDLEPNPESARIENLWKNYDPDEAEQLWEEYQRSREAPHSKSEEQQSPKYWTSSEAKKEIDPKFWPAFDKATGRAAKTLRENVLKNGFSQPIPLGGAGDGWALAKPGVGGHGGGHLLIKINGQQATLQEPSLTDQDQPYF